MHYRKSLSFLTVVVAMAGLVVGGACASATATPTPAPTPTTPPRATATPTSAPAPTTAAATPTATARPTAAPSPTAATTPSTGAPSPYIAPGTPSGAAQLELRRGKRGGTLRAYVDRDLTGGTLDPTRETDGSSYYVLIPLYSTLVRYGPFNTTEINPSLAESWEMSGDQMQITFRLRKDVKWSDGKDFTADDVEFSLRRIMGRTAEKAVASSGPLLSRLIDTVTVTDPSTVVVKLKSPDPQLLPALASSKAAMTPKHVVGEDGAGKIIDKPVGTGPFTLVEWKKDVSIEVQRNPNYYLKDLPYLDRISIIVIKQKSNVIAAFTAGQLDIGHRYGALTGDEAGTIKKNMGDNIILDWAPHTTAMYIRANPQKPPFTDPKVRQAVWLAIDRKEMLDKIWQGVGDPSYLFDPQVYPDWALPASEINAFPGIRQPKDQDIARAKQLMAEAGFPDGLDLTPCRGSTTTVLTDAHQLMVLQLRKVGLRCDSQIEPFATLYSKLTGGDFAITISIGLGTNLAATSIFDAGGFLPTSGGFTGGFTDPVNVQLYQRSLAARDPVQLKNIMTEFQRHIYTSMDFPTIPVVWQKYANLKRPYVKDFYPGIGTFDAHWYDFVWLDK